MIHPNQQHILYKIERLRKEMKDLSKGLSLTDPEIIKVSQRLDQLLNEYEYYRK